MLPFMIFYNGIEIKEDMENIKKAVKSGLINKIVNSKQASSKYEEKYETIRITKIAIM